MQVLTIIMGAKSEKRVVSNTSQVPQSRKAPRVGMRDAENRLCVLSRFSPVLLFATPWTVALQAPLHMGFSRQENWSGLPCPPPGDLPDPGIETVSLTPPALADRFFTAWLRVRNLVKSSGERRGLAGN